MADLKRWPMALNQPGYEYPAELFRAEHHDATSGGNGVGAPTALKVTAQAAPDGTVSILPGGATVKSTYAGADGQSYHARNFQPFTLTVPPTGSGGSRTDLLVLRVCDPQYDVHPDHGGGEISAEDAANLDFWWLELLQGQDRNTSLSYPHVKLAEIVRPANTTIVTDAHIRDLRELANPLTDRTKLSEVVGQRVEVERTGTFRTLREFQVEVPVWATEAIVDVAIGGAYIKSGNGSGSFSFAGLNSSSQSEPTPWDIVDSSDEFHRIPYIQAGRRVSVGAAHRGTVQTIFVTARVDASSDQTVIFGADYWARAFLDIEWRQGVA